MQGFGETQKTLLKLLLKKKEGLTIDELAESLSITRTAVRQHISSLEGSGYLEGGEFHATGGRPSQVYRLTQKGYDVFPKQYSWFSEVLLEAIRNEKGPAELSRFLATLGESIGSSVAGRVQGATLEERVRETVALMNELAYQAEAKEPQKSGEMPRLEATNCIYHALAARFPEVCQLDLALLEKLSGAKVIHEKCIVKGGGVCQFAFAKKSDK